MLALTIKQPWASLIVAGVKDVENRDWATTYRGIIAIHSSARMTREDMDEACDFIGSFVPMFSAIRFRKEEFPTGSILGTAEIVNCVQSHESSWFVGKYGLVLENPIAFVDPIPCKGSLGLWTVPDEIVQLARERYKQAKTLGI